MHDFGKLVYLDVEKTGSSFTRKFLNHACILPAVRKQKHGRIKDGYNPAAFYFITSRHPIAQYSSLYRYGLDGLGGIFLELQRRGKAHLYQDSSEAFNDWLRFMIDPANAAVFGEDYERVVGNFSIGLQTFRFLMLSLFRPMRTLLETPTKSLDDIYARKISNHLIKQEELTEGLRDLALNLKPEFFDREKAENFLAEAGPINASSRPDGLSSKIDDDVAQALKVKERILLDLYAEA